MPGVPTPTRRSARASASPADSADAVEPQTPSAAARAARAAGADGTGNDTGSTSGTGGEAPGPAAEPRARAVRKPALQAKLEQYFAIPAMAFAAGGDTFSAEILSTRGPMVAEAWYELSKENATVRSILNRMVEGGAWGGVIFSTMSVVLPIAKHKGLYRGPDPFAAFLGGPTPPQQQTPKKPGWTRRPNGPMSPVMPPVAGDVPVAPRSERQNPTSPQEAQEQFSMGNDLDNVPVYFDGAPPGVVTVATGTAEHIGAR